MKQFELLIPENGFCFPCCICKNMHEKPVECKSCNGYTMSNMQEYDFAIEAAKLINKEN
jgi:hypothetical protein